MIQDSHPAVPSQLALVTLAHVGKYQSAPNLHHRAVLVTHLLRAYSRAETERGTEIIASDSPLGLKELSKALSAFQRTSPANTDAAAWKEHTESYLEASRATLSAATRYAYSCGAVKSGEVGAAGLSFIFQMEAADKRKECRIKKTEPHANPFLALAIVREILYDIDCTVKEKHGRGLTDKIEFEPISNIERFYREMHRDYPFDVDMVTAPHEKTEECVKILCDLACKIDLFHRSLFQHNGTVPPFRAEEGVSLRMLRDYLEPYKEGREMTLKSQGGENTQKSATLIDFLAHAEKFRGKRGGIIRNLPAVIPPKPTVP